MDFRSLTRRDLQFLCKKNRIPANQTNIAMVNALQALETVEGIEEIQEVLAFQSPKKPESKSPAHPPTSQRVSACSIQGDKPKNQEQLASSQPRSCRVTVKPMEVIEMDSKEEGEKKEATKHFPKTPATTRRASRGQEASSSSAKAKQEDGASVVTPTSGHSGRTRLVKRVAIETPKVVEAKEGKTIGVTRRSTRLSSRKAVEATITAKAESRSNRSKAKEAVKMSSLAKEDAEEQETEEEKKACLENGDSSVLLVEDVGKNDQEVKTLRSSLDVENSKIEVSESPEEVGENNKKIESHGISSFDNPEEDAAGKQLVDAPLLEKSSIVTPLPGEIGSPEKNSTEVNGSVEEDEVGENNREIESHGISSFDNPEEDAAGKQLVYAPPLEKSSIATPLPGEIGLPEKNSTEVNGSVEEDEVGENNREIESHGISSFDNPEEDAAGKQLVYAPLLEKSSIVTPLPAEIGSPEKNSTEVKGSVEEEEVGENREIESHGLPSFLNPEEEEAAGNELVHASLLKKTSIRTPLPAEIGSTEENYTEVKESKILNEAFAFVKNSSEETPTDSSSSGAKVTISSDTEMLLLPCGVEKEEEEKIALLFTEMTLKEAEESGDALPEAGIVQASLIFVNSTSETDFVEEARVTSVDGCSTETNYTEFPNEADESTNSPPAVVALEDAPLDCKNLDAISDLCVEPLVAEGIGVSFAFASESRNKVNEIAGEQIREIPVVTEDSIDRDLQVARELEVAVEMPHETTETLQDEVKETGSNHLTGELAVKEFVDVPPRHLKSSSATVGGSMSESADAGKETSGEFSSKISMVNETSIDVLQQTEILQEALDSKVVQIQSTDSEVANLAVVEMAEKKEEMKAVETEEGADDGSERDICSTETTPLFEFSEVVQSQSSEVANLAAVEMAEEKEEMKAVETEEGADDSNELNGGGRDMPLSEFSKVFQIQSIDSEVANQTVVEMAEEKEEVVKAVETQEMKAVEMKAVEAEEGADDDSYELNGSKREVVCLTETIPLSEISIVVQIQSTDSQVADLAAVEMTEEKEETKAVETQKSFEDQNRTAELLPKQGDGKNEAWMVEEKWDKSKSVRKVKDEKLVDLSLTKLRAMYKQKLDDRKNEMEGSKYGSTQNLNDDLQCLSHGKLYACTQKLNDDRSKLGKRTPLKNLN